VNNKTTMSFLLGGCEMITTSSVNISQLKSYQNSFTDGLPNNHCHSITSHLKLVKKHKLIH